MLNNFLGEERLKVFELSNSVTMTHVEEPKYNSRWWIMHITYFGNGNYFPDIITQLGLHIICGRSFQRSVLSHLLISRDIHGYKVFSEYILRNFWGVLLYLHKNQVQMWYLKGKEGKIRQISRFRSQESVLWNSFSSPNTFILQHLNPLEAKESHEIGM